MFFINQPTRFAAKTNSLIYSAPGLKRIINHAGFIVRLLASTVNGPIIIPRTRIPVIFTDYNQVQVFLMAMEELYEEMPGRRQGHQA